MSWDSNPYYHPEQYGLTEIGELDNGGSYEFDKLVIWQQDATGLLYYDTDSGCSCPTPFDDCTLETMTPLPTPQALIDAVNGWLVDSYRTGLRGEAGSLIVKAREVGVFERPERSA